ncbi:MAG: glycosyltransferase family 2 protein [Paenibacillus sp.]|nr:glycosyltransferase family 2 protein [Paenibacillus sp.]
MNFPKISFGIIVLNGEPFTRYCIRALYPFAHEIIVVEGAAPAAASIATPDGHSIDSTLVTLRDFKEHEDPENKVHIVTAEDDGHPNGFWPGEKDEQSQAYAKRATGEYLWQVDIDEFYKPEDMQAIITMLQSNPEITAVSFKMITFWGGFDYITDGWYLRRGANIYHRLFKWCNSYSYTTHRPPTVYDSQGRDLRSLKWVNGHELARQGIFLYHYSLTFPKQVAEKCAYYKSASWAGREKALEWAEKVFFQLEAPYRVHNVYDYPSWLERFYGEHPLEIKQMIKDIKSGHLKIELRQTDDVEKLLNSTNYRIGRLIVKALDYVKRPFDETQRGTNWAFKRLINMLNRIKITLQRILHLLGWQKKSTRP